MRSLTRISQGNADRQPIGRRYLRENLMFRLTPRAIAGLETYYREAVALGVAPREHRPEFFRRSEP